MNSTNVSGSSLLCFKSDQLANIHTSGRRVLLSLKWTIWNFPSILCSRIFLSIRESRGWFFRLVKANGAFPVEVNQAPGFTWLSYIWTLPSSICLSNLCLILNADKNTKTAIHSMKLLMEIFVEINFFLLFFSTMNLTLISCGIHVLFKILIKILSRAHEVVCVALQYLNRRLSYIWKIWYRSFDRSIFIHLESTRPLNLTRLMVQLVLSIHN